MAFEAVLQFMLAAVVAAPVAFALLRLQPGHLADDRADDPSYTRTVAIVIHDSVELLDFAGPGEVFEVAGGLATDRGRRALRVITVGPTAAPVRSQGFLDIVPNFAAGAAPAPAVLVVPGGDRAVALSDPGFLRWIEGAAARAEVALSVCTGAFVLGAIGALDGREVTTWHGRVAHLAAAVPRARVVAGRRFVDSGEVVTTAGVSAGIDGALHVVARLLGTRIARRTAAYMEYDWTADDDRLPSLNPSTDDAGRRVQDGSFPDGDVPPADAVRSLREVLEHDPDHGDAWFHLARALVREGAFDDALVASNRATGFGWTASAARYDRACVHALRGDRDAAFDDLAAARAAGFTPDAAHDPDLEGLRADPRWTADRPATGRRARIQVRRRTTNRLPPDGAGS